MRSERCPQRGHGASGATADARIVNLSSSRSRVSTCNERGIGKTAGTTGHLLRRRSPDGGIVPGSSQDRFTKSAGEPPVPGEVCYAKQLITRDGHIDPVLLLQGTRD